MKLQRKRKSLNAKLISEVDVEVLEWREVGMLMLECKEGSSRLI